ncbi:hypothetical protein C2E23DRAFT_825118 [Lenzites betulinus]|nr:hypothetical protein C2E23DRAFT_825118 [Lenzites betulinus]
MYSTGCCIWIYVINELEMTTGVAGVMTAIHTSADSARTSASQPLASLHPLVMSAPLLVLRFYCQLLELRLPIFIRKFPKIHTVNGVMAVYSTTPTVNLFLRLAGTFARQRATALLSSLTQQVCLPDVRSIRPAAGCSEARFDTPYFAAFAEYSRFRRRSRDPLRSSRPRASIRGQST